LVDPLVRLARRPEKIYFLRKAPIRNMSANKENTPVPPAGSQVICDMAWYRAAIVRNERSLGTFQVVQNIWIGCSKGWCILVADSHYIDNRFES